MLRAAGASAAGLLAGVAAMGNGAAKGKGGKAAVDNDNLPEDTRAFYFDEPNGELKRKRCSKGGQGIVLAGWSFHYEGEDPSEVDRVIYTRDNAIDTDVRYVLAEPGTVECGDFVLANYSPDGSP